jgi:hypothetical protein
LAEYDYDYARETVPSGVRAVAVGWLDRDHEFRRGSVPDGFLDLLFAACRDNRWAVTRGWYRCLFCPCDRSDELPPPPRTANRGGETVFLGDAEVRFVGDQVGRWLVAPTLIFHYVEAHAYRPPDEFVDAVMAGRIAPSD